MYVCMYACMFVCMYRPWLTASLRMRLPISSVTVCKQYWEAQFSASLNVAHKYLDDVL